MKILRKIPFLLIACTLLASVCYAQRKPLAPKVSYFTHGRKTVDSHYITYQPDLNRVTIKMHWQGKDGSAFKDLKTLVAKSPGRKILFAINGGIYSTRYTPEGLYIEPGKTLSALNLCNGQGNFYSKPNGVFYIENGVPKIIDANAFKDNASIDYAVQSGPLLIKDGVIGRQFDKGSPSVKTRSAVGLNREGQVFFLMSQTAVSFYDFADYALTKLDARQLLFLDGTICKMYFAGEKPAAQGQPFVTMISGEEKYSQTPIK